MKGVIRSGVAAGCAATGLLDAAERRAAAELVILCYHRVLPAEHRAAYFIPDLAVTPEAFEAHCALLRELYDVRPLSAAVAAWRAAERRDRPLAAITFDDGYGDNYTYAAPILAKAGLGATFFVITDLVGTAAVPWYDRLARAALVMHAKLSAKKLAQGITPPGFPAGPLPRDPRAFARQVVATAKRVGPAARQELVADFESLAAGAGLAGAAPACAATAEDALMTWPQLAELAAAGHEIGSHTCTHELLPQLEHTALQHELCASRAALEARLGQAVHSLCYPNGDADARVVRAARDAGYTTAVNMQPGNNPPGQDALALRRHFMQEERLSGVNGRTSPRLFRLQLCGLADRVFAREARRRHETPAGDGIIAIGPSA